MRTKTVEPQHISKPAKLCTDSRSGAIQASGAAAAVVRRGHPPETRPHKHQTARCRVEIYCPIRIK